MGTVQRGKLHIDGDGGAIIISRRCGRWSNYSYTTMWTVERGKLHIDWGGGAIIVTRRWGRWGEESYTTMGDGSTHHVVSAAILLG